jgi:2-succinyl-5-enolpyruvyl-6-hydroxy-3-cyclohexene-1-carboxylate synthase
MATTSAKKGVQQFLSLCKSHELKKIVFSPGSRSAPLVLGFANNDAFETYIIPDERSAAFYALGMAEELNEVVAVVCTSGSALLNYYPAISEAFYRNIPLMIISADRPLEWTDQGDGQTIRQEHVFQNHILAQTTLFEDPKDKDQQWFNQRETSRLFNKAMSSAGGPVHINFPFSEPLYEMEEIDLEEVTITSPVTLNHELTTRQKETVQYTWNSSPKKLILCGQMPKHPKLLHELKQLAKDPSVAIVVENTSNLQDRAFNHCIDRTLNSFQQDHPTLFQPDLMITMGGAVISKKIKKYLRAHPPKTHWKVGFAFPEMDTYQGLTHSFEMDPAEFIEYLSSGIGFERGLSRYGEQWKQLDYQIQDLHRAYLQSVNYSDLAVFDLLLDAVPDQAILHLANSSVVRYAQLFDALSTITYRCNRGTSGIDGSISTAIGSAIAEPNKLHVIITGDISFFYDSNAFWNNHVPSNIRVFLINNNGGGIFSIIPGPQSTPQGEDYFVTSNNAKAEGIADAFGLNYYKSADLSTLDSQLQAFYGWQDSEKAAIMEILTPKDKNAAILDEYWEKIKVKGIEPLKI